MVFQMAAEGGQSWQPSFTSALVSGPGPRKQPRGVTRSVRISGRPRLAMTVLVRALVPPNLGPQGRCLVDSDPSGAVQMGAEHPETSPGDLRIEAVNIRFLGVDQVGPPHPTEQDRPEGAGPIASGLYHDVVGAVAIAAGGHQNTDRPERSPGDRQEDEDPIGRIGLHGIDNAGDGWQPVTQDHPGMFAASTRAPVKCRATTSASRYSGFADD